MISGTLVERDRREGVPITAFERALRGLARRVPALRWAVIASVDGVVKAMYDPFGRERPDRILALVSSVLALGERVFEKLQHGRLTCLTLAGETGAIVACPIGPAYIMAASIAAEAEVGAAAHTLEQVARTLHPALCPAGV